MKCKIEECKSIKIRARGLCATHWNLEQYGECSNGCRQPASNKMGLCPNCKKRGDVPPVNRNLGCQINDNEQRLCSRCKAVFPLEEFNRSNHKHRCTKCQTAMKKHSSLVKKYKITLDEFNTILASQGGGCAICKKIDRVMVVDHDHSCCNTAVTCGKCIRGIVCDQCNRAIGLLSDSPETAYSAYEYLLER